MPKEVIIIAGANGVGKTTFAHEFLLENPEYEFLNADEIAKEISPENPAGSKIAAGKAFFKKLDQVVENGKSFLIESTLSGRYLQKLFEIWKLDGYRIRLIFLFVKSPEMLLERIAERVKKGGHFVPEQDVRRRLIRGRHNFKEIYKNIADEWFLYYNTEEGFQLVATGEKEREAVISEDLFERF